MGYNFRNGIIRWRLWKSTEVVLQMFYAILRFHDIIVTNVWLWKVVQGHGVQLS